jgi:murein DD-endopeptidase MepM/ murein hydrolase activator NlpD
VKAPFSRSSVTSLYGATANRPNPHRGLDFGVRQGSPIRFGTNARVMFVRWSDCLGWVISFRFMHQGKILYAAHSHLLRKPKFKANELVTADQVAGLVGNTGACSRGAHDHLTVGLTAEHVFQGATIDPLTVLDFD